MHSLEQLKKLNSPKSVEKYLRRARGLNNPGENPKDVEKGRNPKRKLSPVEQMNKEASVYTLVKDYPFFDGTDAAHPAWWRGNDAGVDGAVRRIEEVLSGKDDGSGVLGYAPLENLRRRLIGLRKVC